MANSPDYLGKPSKVIGEMPPWDRYTGNLLNLVLARMLLRDSRDELAKCVGKRRHFYPGEAYS